MNDSGIALIRSRYLPHPWATRLQELARRDFTEWQKGKYGEWFLLSPNDLSEVINAELACPHLNEKFVQTTDS